MNKQREALTSVATPALNSSSRLPPLWPPDPAPRRYCDAEDEVRRSSSAGALDGGGDIGESLQAAAAEAVSLLPPVPADAAAAAAAAAAAVTLSAADEVTTPVPLIGTRSFFSFLVIVEDF